MTVSRGSYGAMAAISGVCAASGWIGVGVDQLRKEPSTMNSAGAGVWLALPLAAVGVTRALRRATPGRWDARSRPWRWYAVAAAAFPAVSAASLAVGRIAGWVDFSGLQPKKLASEAWAGFQPAVVKNVFEEAVWRGYFVDELVRRGASDPTVYLGSGLIWGLWHVPYYLFFLPEEQIREVVNMSRGGFALAAAGTMLAWAVPFAELHRRSGSIWPAVLMHSVEDAVVNPIIQQGHAKIAPERAAVVSPVIGVLSSALHVAFGLALRHLRRRAERR